MLDNPAAIQQFIPSSTFDKSNLGKFSLEGQQPIFKNNDKDDDGSGNDEEEDDDSIPDDQEDLSNQEDEYDDSEEAEDEDYPYADSDPEEESKVLTNGRPIDSSNSSPAKEANGDSKIEKFA